MKTRYQVRDAMTFMPDTIQGNATVAEGLRMMRVNRYRHLPVAVRGKPVGIVSDRDLKWALSLGLPETTPLSGIMTEEPFCVKAADELVEVIPTLLEHKYGSAIVVDPRGEIIGILTSSDLLRTLGEVLAHEAARRLESIGV